MGSVGRLQFTFEQCLGKGGFGEVYLTTLHKPGGLRQKVAVKVLKPDLSQNEDAVRRLRDEARMLTTLNHPAILRAHELARVAGRVALITEYVEGIDLARCCRSKSLLPHRVLLGVIGEVAGALDAAWTTPSPDTGRPLHLIHRDIKPENIRIGVHGRTKLLDFGIARTTEIERDAKTQIGETPFTPGYASPETFATGRHGPESDVYSLGVTLYRALAGERFYQGMDLGQQVQTAAFPDDYAAFLTQRVSGIEADARILELLQLMLAFDKGKRPTAAQVREVCEFLEDQLAGDTLSRWVRKVDFPPPRALDGASLTGQTMHADPTDSGAGPVFAGLGGAMKLPAGLARPAPRVVTTPEETAPPTPTPAGPPPVPPRLASSATPPMPPRSLRTSTANPAMPRLQSMQGLPSGLRTVAPTPAMVTEEESSRRRRVPPVSEDKAETTRRRRRLGLGLGLGLVVGLVVMGGGTVLLALLWAMN